MKAIRKLALTAAVFSAAIAPTVHAATIMGAGALPGSNAINLPAINLTGSGPVTFDGMKWFSNVATSKFGWTNGYVFGNATVPAGEPPIIALDAGHIDGAYATMTLVFPTLTSGFLGEFFWTDFTSAGNSVNLAAHDANGNLLEQLFLNDNGRPIGNQPGYYGFLRAQADIAYINLNNGFVGARNLRWIGPEINPVSAVPEPASWLILVLGFGLVGATARRSRSPHLSNLTAR